MNIVREYVGNLSDDEKIQIIKGYEQFETDGVIGDEPIRIHATKIIQQYGISEALITSWMNMLAFECHRVFSLERIAELSA